MATKDISDLQVCIAVRAADCARKARRGWMGGPAHVQRVLHTISGQPEKVCWRALERAAGRELIECGIGLQGSWLTNAGRALLDAAPQVRDGWGSAYRVGDFVTRGGDDVQILIYWEDDGGNGEFLCVIPPAPNPDTGEPWCAQGDIESNLTRRYTRVETGLVIDAPGVRTTPASYPYPSLLAAAIMLEHRICEWLNAGGAKDMPPVVSGALAQLCDGISAAQNSPPGGEVPGGVGERDGN